MNQTECLCYDEAVWRFKVKHASAYVRMTLASSCFTLGRSWIWLSSLRPSVHLSRFFFSVSIKSSTHNEMWAVSVCGIPPKFKTSFQSCQMARQFRPASYNFCCSNILFYTSSSGRDNLKKKEDFCNHSILFLFFPLGSIWVIFIYLFYLFYFFSK